MVVRSVDLVGDLVKCFILFIVEANDFCDQSFVDAEGDAIIKEIR